MFYFEAQAFATEPSVHMVSIRHMKVSGWPIRGAGSQKGTWPDVAIDGMPSFIVLLF